MIQLAAFTVFALLLARVLGAPRRAFGAILGAAALVAAASQLLPAGHPLRIDLAASARSLGWAALVLAPVAAYAYAIMRIRRRTGADVIGQPHPRGLVQIAEDAALTADTARALAEDETGATGSAPATISFAWRAEDGVLVGHLRLCLSSGLGEIAMIRVAAGHRRQGIGRQLVAAAEAAARAEGCSHLIATVAPWQAPGFFAACGFRAYARLDQPGASGREHLEKPLP